MVDTRKMRRPRWLATFILWLIREPATKSKYTAQEIALMPTYYHYGGSTSFPKIDRSKEIEELLK